MADRVLILIADPYFRYKDENSAVLRFLNTVKASFKKRGCEVEFALGQEAIIEQHAEESVNQVYKANSLKNLLKKWNWLYQSVALIKYFRAQKKLFKQIEKYKKYDLIVEYHILGSTMGADLKKKWGCRLNVIFDSPSPEQFQSLFGTKSAFWNRINRSEKNTMESADRIMAYSPAAADYLKKRFSVSEINILPCLVHKEVIQQKKTSTSSFNIGFIGSFLPWHDLELLVETFKEFYKNHQNSKLILIGYGLDWNKIKALVNEIGIDEHVEMPGFVSEEELAVYKSKFSVGVMPGSNWYGSPLKLFEYAQMAIPFIAPPSPTVLSIFENEKHCLYVANANPQKSLKKALERFYENEEFRQSIGNNARDFVNSEFNETVYLDKLYTFLR